MQRERSLQRGCLLAPEQYRRLRQLGRLVARHGDMETDIRRFEDYRSERERRALAGDDALVYWDAHESGSL